MIFKMKHFPDNYRCMAQGPFHVAVIFAMPITRLLHYNNF